MNEDYTSRKVLFDFYEQEQTRTGMNTNKCNQDVIEMKSEESLGIDRKVWSKYCPKCKYEDDNEGIPIYYSCDWDGGIGFESDDAIFCPKCGRPLTTEAWNKLEERLMGKIILS